MSEAKLEMHEMIIPSLPEQIQRVEEKCEQMAGLAGFADDERDAIAIAITEMVANAIYHGNKSNPKKSVRIRFYLQTGGLTVHITDQGEGFDPKAVPNPLLPENLLKDNGRGIFIVRSMMDSVEYRFEPGGGTTVILTKCKKSDVRD
ncbi:MAG TPA: ATP-binding protein [bacterium]|nr:ATP-binding protein [bacterium]HOH06368.1 ATP-binding protein [bacterium]HOY45710.1 ATP-binding protein [bacterium]HPG83574.1 ATP-binding protein [bacterium]HPM60036.1 ATP-binding protein [bacterium]